MYLDSLRATIKKYQISKRQAMMAYMDSGFKILFPPLQTRYRNK